MLRDLPHSFRDADQDVFMNTALGLRTDNNNDGEEYQRSAERRGEILDDIFGSDGEEEQGPPLPADHSDIPRLRSTHVTNGYREGIAASKEKHMQEGFDEGYNLGAEVGLKAGWRLGALEGIWRALPSNTPSAKSEATEGNCITREEVRNMLDRAEEELKLESLFGKEHFGEDGIWLYEVPGQNTTDEEVTFEQIADAHPVLQVWRKQVLHLAKDVGLELR
jgi:hypothetical protein